MIEIPSTPWRERPWRLAEAIAAAPAAAAWLPLPGIVRHGFTHFRLELRMVAGRAEGGEGLWSPLERLGEHALPSLVKKLVRHAVSALAAEAYAGVAEAANSDSSPAAASRTGANERR